MKRRLAALALLAGCSRTLPVELPLLPGERSALVIVALAEPQVFAVDPTLELFPHLVIGPERPRLYLRTHAETLAELRLAQGPVRLDTGDRSRPLPPAARQLQAEDPDEPWGASEDALELRLAPADWESCARSGGCFDPQRSDTFCAPCPDPAERLEPAPPTPPGFTRAAPSLQASAGEPCPDRWTPVAAVDAMPAHCAPPKTAPSTCPFDQVSLPRAPACAAIAEPCAGPFPSALPGERALYVSPAAAAGGDGSAAAPWRTIAEAALQASPGDTLLLAAGDYAEDVHLSGVSLRGCGAATRISGQQEAAALRVAQVVRLEHLTITGPADALVVEGGASLVGRGLLLDRPGGRGLWISEGATAALQRVYVREPGGEAARAAAGAHLSLRGARLEYTEGAGLICEGAAVSCALEDAVVRGGPAPPGAGCFSVALHAGGEGAVLTATAVHVLQARRVGVQGALGARLSLADLTVAGTSSCGTEAFAVDLALQDAELALTGAQLLDSAGFGMTIGRGGRAAVAQAVISTTRGIGHPARSAISAEEAALSVRGLEVSGFAPHALRLIRSRADVADLWLHTLGSATSEAVLAQGSTLALDRAQLETWTATAVSLTASTLAARDLALWAGAGAALDGVVLRRSLATLERVELAGTLQQGIVAGEQSALQLFGLRAATGAIDLHPTPGVVLALTGSQVEVASCTLSRAGYALAVNRAAATLEDCVVQTTAEVTPALLAHQGSLELRRVVILPREEGGLLLEAPGASAHLEDVSITGGRIAAITARDEVELTLSRVAIQDLARAGIMVGSGADRATVSGKDVLIHNVRGLGDDTGTGLLVVSGQVTLERFRIDSAETYGLWASDGGVRLSDGEISGAKTGARLDQPGFDVARVAERVRYQGQPRVFELH